MLHDGACPLCEREVSIPVLRPRVDLRLRALAPLASSEQVVGGTGEHAAQARRGRGQNPLC